MDDFDTPQIITHIEHNINHSIFDCKWIPCSAKFVVIGCLPKGSGTIEIFEITSGEARKIKDIERPNSFKCGTFGASSDVERRLATGDFKGTMEIWDLEKSCQVYITKEHTDIINSIDGMGGNTVNCGAPEIVTGSRDGTVKVWDPRQRGKPVANMQPAKGETKRDCWTVAFGNSFNDAERIVVAGYDNGDLKMFDLRTMSLRWECNLKNGVCCAEFDRKDIPMNKLVATTLEGKFHVFDVRTQNPTKGFAQIMDNTSKSGTIWVARHLPQNRDVFITCAGNGQVTLWKYEYPEQRCRVDDKGVAVGVPGKLRRLQRMVVSTQPINALQWNSDHLGLAIATAYDQWDSETGCRLRPHVPLHSNLNEKASPIIMPESRIEQPIADDNTNCSSPNIQESEFMQNAQTWSDIEDDLDDMRREKSAQKQFTDAYVQTTEIVIDEDTRLNNLMFCKFIAHELDKYENNERFEKMQKILEAFKK